MHKIAKALLEYETLSADDVEAALKGEAIHRPSADEPAADKGAPATVPKSGSSKKHPAGLEPEPQPGS